MRTPLFDGSADRRRQRVESYHAYTSYTTVPKMKSQISLALAALALGTTTAAAASDKSLRDEPVTRSGTQLLLAGQPWRAVGANAYWLALDENIVPPPEGQPFDAATNSSYPTRGRVAEAMAIVKAMGGTMLRAHTLGANSGNPLSLLPDRRTINEEAFAYLDWAVYQAREHDLRLMVPLVDQYVSSSPHPPTPISLPLNHPNLTCVKKDYYHGGKYNYLRWAGYNLTFAANPNDPAIMHFYLDPPIVSDFHWFVTQLLTHVNPHTNLSYADDPTIFAIESGNELYGPVRGSSPNCPAPWVRDLARLVKSLAPAKLFVDGTYGVDPDHLAVEEVDVFSDHFYPLDAARLRQGMDAVAAAGRTYFAGEYDWTGLNGGDDLAAFYEVLRGHEAWGGDAFWSLFGRNVPNCQVRHPPHAHTERERGRECQKILLFGLTDTALSNG